jgi:hypothetical protein
LPTRRNGETVAAIAVAAVDVPAAVAAGGGVDVADAAGMAAAVDTAGRGTELGYR